MSEVENILSNSLPVEHESAPPVPESLARDLTGHRPPRFFLDTELGMTWVWRNGKMTINGQDSLFKSPSQLLACLEVIETDADGNPLELSAADIAAEKADKDNQAKADES